MAPAAASRLVIAGLAGDSGKTLVSLALTLAWREQEREVRAFKKGPDYIDAAWLQWASQAPARNLDTFLMGRDRVKEQFARHASRDGLNVIEGNRGLFDGSDAGGTHSTAELARLLDAPVVLVVSVTKVTRTAAAYVLGCRHMDPALRIAGVVLNRVAGARHEQVVRDAIETTCGIPVFGALPRVPREELLPDRHLGLVPPAEMQRREQARQTLLAAAKRYLDIAALRHVAEKAGFIEVADPPPASCTSGGAVRIGYLRDSAFTFYYPENLEALAQAGAELVPINALQAGALPEQLDALYIGGGFPETHGAALEANRGFLESLRRQAQAGLPVYAECGGLMLLSRAIRWQGKHFRMAGVLPLEVEVCPRPQGHGYSILRVDRPNAFYETGKQLKGHEFHYSRILLEGAAPETACAVERGTGCFPGRDGIVVGSVWAGYTHVHAVSAPEWVQGLLRAAKEYRKTGDKRV